MHRRPSRAAPLTHALLASAPDPVRTRATGPAPVAASPVAAAIFAPGARAAPPADYASNLHLIRSATARNANHDDSPWRDVPQRDLVREDHLGPRSEYVGPSAFADIVQDGQEWADPAPTTGQFRMTCEFSHFAYDDPPVYPGRTTEWAVLDDPSPGDHRVPLASLYQQLCPDGMRIDSAAAGAHCRPAGSLGGT